MEIETIRRVVLSRELYEVAANSLRSANDMRLFVAVNLMQDAVEAFLAGLAGHLQCKVKQHTKFDRYFELINDEIAPKELPFKAKLLRLNQLRIGSKHYGNQPERSECERMLVVVREFFDEVCESILGQSFASISAIDLLEEGDAKELLKEAQEALAGRDHETCAIAYRKALYCEIEHHYDISYLAPDAPWPFIWHLKLACFSPYHAQNKEYFEKNVKEPTDFIVYDKAKISEKLLVSGTDNTAFWNVLKLTPAVFKRRSGEWVVKHDFAKLDAEALAYNIEYIFSATFDIVLSLHRFQKPIQDRPRHLLYLELSSEQVPVYSKADVTSEMTAKTPPGLTKLYTSYRVEGLKGDGLYWFVIYGDEKNLQYGFIYYSYVKELLNPDIKES